MTNVRCDISKFTTFPGSTVAHSPAASGVYIATPGIVRLPDGTYIAKWDEHGPNSAADHDLPAITAVARSTDRGEHWERIATVEGIYWANLFLHHGALYMLGPVTQCGDLVIVRSTDGGVTWTQPTDARNGLLRRGRFHTSSMPVLTHEGRLWRTMETLTPGDGNRWFKHVPFLMSIPEEADPLDAAAWTFGEPLERQDAAWLGGEWRTWLEGNPVVLPDGTLGNLLRCDYREGGHEKAMLTVADPTGTHLRFDPETGFIDLPGGCKKFNVRFDPETSHYWTLSNYVPERHHRHNPERARNTSALLCSLDLIHWEARCGLFYGDDILHHGFQYADFTFEGDDLLALYRTAYDDGQGGAHNQHDANFITFHRIPNFRTLTPAESVAPWLAADLERYNSAL